MKPVVAAMAALTLATPVEAQDGQSVIWLGPVTDAEYRAPAIFGGEAGPSPSKP